MGVPATDTPVAALPSSTPNAPAPTLGPTEVANVAPSANPTLFRPAVPAQGSTTATIVAPAHAIFPVPALAGSQSPLTGTTPFTPGVTLHLTTQAPSNPGSLAVFIPSTTPQSPTDLLSAFGFTPIKMLSKSSDAKSVTLVRTGSLTYRAALTVRSAGYALHLTLLNPVQGSNVVDSVSAARTFLTQHGLAAGAEPAGVRVATGGDKVALFTQATPYLVQGARAQVTVSAGGQIRMVDIQWVDTTRAALAPSISASTALSLISLGQGVVHSTGALPTTNDSVAAPSIVYLPAGSASNLYFEPVYVFNGHSFGGADFQIYLPALDPSYLG